jgi:cytidyltransferase-like protein
MTRIVIFGTFDGIHEGHRDFFRQARTLGREPHLTASLARDVNVARVKGRPPYESEDERLTAISDEPLIDEAVLGSLDADYISHVISLQPDIIALGYDQESSYVEHLAEKLKERGCTPEIIRCKPHHPELYKSSKIKRD